MFSVKQSFFGLPLTQLLLVALFDILLVACASAPTSYEQMEARKASANPSPASYGADAFSLDYRGIPTRPYEKRDFYFKHCELEARGAWPKKDEWECTPPQ